MRNERELQCSRSWEKSIDVVLKDLGVDPHQGLRRGEAERRLQIVGPNLLRDRQKRSTFDILSAQLRSPIVALLVCAAVLSFWLGGVSEGASILIVIVINTMIGFVVELRAVRSMDALRSLGSARSRVRRGDHESMISAQNIVPGDILILEAGDAVGADARLVEAVGLFADESTFTGESAPVAKQCDPVVGATRVDQRDNMLFKGTALTSGSCEAVVVATGMDTELGGIAELTEDSGTEVTPLEEQLARVGNKLIGLTGMIVIVVVAVGVAAGKSTQLMIETGVALAVATIPEGLPIVATIALARGLWRMSRRNALVNRLSAVETLGATTIICTDKTGTLTENRMRLVSVRTADGEVDLESDDFSHEKVRIPLEIGALCNRASLGEAGGEGVGDPLELALLLAGADCGISRDSLIDGMPEVAAEAFDSRTKMMATVHRCESVFRVAVKGAPEVVLACCVNDQGKPLGEEEGRWLQWSAGMAAGGLRVIAVADKVVTDPDEAPYTELRIRALLGLLDPPRLEVKSAISICHTAGIRVLMITGDHADTAGAIARAVGIVPDDTTNPLILAGDAVDELEQGRADFKDVRSSNVFARVSPEQKLKIIRMHQMAGEKVAMIGDGVNDAPALEQADIGVAMGMRGTQVAREASDMVLADDSFASIVAAVEQGRVIYGNIRRFVVYLLSCNISEVLVLGIAAGLKAPLPILPLQILFLNLVSDIFPALALGVGRGPAGIMQKSPRDPKENILDPRSIRWILVFGLVMTGSVLGAFFLTLGPLNLGRDMAVTSAFLTLAFAQLWHVFNMRDPQASIFYNDITRNPWIWGALTLCTLLLALALFVPPIAVLLDLVVPTRDAWFVVLGFSVIPVLFGQAWFLFLRKYRTR